jgi:phosphatidate cytidylyltransferase
MSDDTGGHHTFDLQDEQENQTPIATPERGLDRVISGAIFAGTITLVIFIGYWPTVIAFSLIAAVCAFEFYTLLRTDAKLPNELIGTIAAGLYPLSYAVFGFYGAIYLTLLLLTALMVWYVFYMRARITDVAITFFGAFYTGLILTAVVLIRGQLTEPSSAFLTYGVIFSVWANDTMAFCVGRAWGKHKFAPRISPKKSYEGFYGGMVATIIIWCTFLFIPDVHQSIWWAIIGGVLCSLAAVLGDLVESRIKRSTGHKDSGNILRGHGGLLDRMDSLLLSICVAVLYFLLTGVF